MTLTRKNANDVQEKMANIYLSLLFPCLVGVIRTVRCVPFSPIISAINAAQQDSSRAINTSPGPHTASTSSPRHSLMMEKNLMCFAPFLLQILTTPGKKKFSRLVEVTHTFRSKNTFAPKYQRRLRRCERK